MMIRKFRGGYRSSVKFAVYKISKIYPLHIVTMLMVLPLKALLFYADGLTKELLLGFVRDLVLNVFLLQSWYPAAGVNISLNGVAWFLSCMAFLYFMFPSINGWLHKKHKVETLVCTCIMVLALQLLVSAVALKINPEWSFYRWIAYDAPFFRLGDFFVGCVVGYLYLRNQRCKNLDENDRCIFTCWELFALCSCISITYWDQLEHRSFVGQVLNNYTTIYMPLAIATILLFMVKKGLVTAMLVNKVFLFIGKKSSYYFLIHYVVIQYIMVPVLYFRLPRIGWILTPLELLLTMVGTWIYCKIEPGLKRVNHHFLNLVTGNQ